MASVASTFTAVGSSSELKLGSELEEVTLAISGTYIATVVVEREVARGSGAWIVVLGPFSVANATVARQISARRNDSFRVTCTAFTSGTVTYSISDGDKIINEIVDRDGNTIMRLRQSGVYFPLIGDITNLKIGGVAVGSTAAELNILDGATPIVEEINELDHSVNCVVFQDFLGDALPAGGAIKNGSGTNNAAVISAGQGGRLSLKSSSADAGASANATAWEVGGLNWRADMGGLVMECRIQCDDISEAYMFVGFTDVAPTGTLELPIFLVAGDIDSDAANACGACFDDDGTTKEWFHGGVKANADTTPAYSGALPTEDAYQIVRVEVSAAGGVRVKINGTYIGAEIANAITVTTPLVPVVIVCNRSANAVTCLVDYIKVMANR